jgi:copper homeostasis protein
MNAARTYKLESCVTSLKEAKYAQKRGADRVEICAHLETEGLTPLYHLVSSLCDHLNISIRVMIRVTADGFAVDNDQLVEMIMAINEFKHLSIDGFVFGVMKDRRVDQYAMSELIHHAHPFPITFHKAIDLSDDLASDLDWLNQHPGIDTILTSGGAERAVDGIPQLLRMKSIFRGSIMPGGKIKPEDVAILDNQLQLPWYHGRAIL